MPRLTIDEREIEVPPGTKVIEAAARLGIMIPRFCYHPALGSVGACRMCAVTFQEGPVKGVQMSCMVDAEDGMMVSTTDAEAVEFRRFVVEWLMLNHPHDCPVCDEGGHCLLQDMTVSSGHGIRRYRGRKRTYPDQDLGPLVEHEMNRCIHCYRCARYYQEYQRLPRPGGDGLGNRTYFGRIGSGTLESPFAGNLVDLCPTGVFTDKPSRYFGRRWDYQRRPTVCIHCSLGCGTVTSVRYRQVARQEARFSPAVNGWFVCDRGRHGFHYASRAERPRQARVQAERAGFDDALAHGRERLAAVQASGGPRSVALVASARGSLETLAAAAALARTRGWRGPAVFAEDRTARNVAAALARLEPELAVSLREIERADCVLVVGADPLHEAPMLALAVRQAARAGAAVVTVDPRAVWLPCAHAHIPVAPTALAEALGRLLRAAIPAEGLSGEAARFHATLPAGSAETSGPNRGPRPACGRAAGRSSSAAPTSRPAWSAWRRTEPLCSGPPARTPGSSTCCPARTAAGRAARRPRGLRAVRPAGGRGWVGQGAGGRGERPPRVLPGPRPARGGPRAAGTPGGDRLSRFPHLAPRRNPAALPDRFRGRRDLRQQRGPGPGKPARPRGRRPRAPIPARATTRRGSSGWGCPGPTRGRRGGSWQASQARRATKLHRAGCGATWPRPAPGTRRCASCRAPRGRLAAGLGDERAARFEPPPPTGDRPRRIRGRGRRTHLRDRGALGLLRLPPRAARAALRRAAPAGCRGPRPARGGPGRAAHTPARSG